MRLNKVGGRHRDILRHACRGYISTLLTMMLEGDDEVEKEERRIGKLDSIRVNYHTVIEAVLGIEYNSEAEKRLNQILHSLQTRIDFPIPERWGYEKVTEDLDLLVEKHEHFTKKYSRKLYYYFMDEMADAEISEESE